ncbi:hypothetical protein MKZ38_010428 [Zalerion maritima]|uniref:tetrahydrofolate synthase n=1 Tax=Zalerion maritima TaxID=339359 RepID=A0AAD5S0L5_9PEZI|nr:hypothetical protein MKZ38_010428 [Zalerion maritima]
MDTSYENALRLLGKIESNKEAISKGTPSIDNAGTTNSDAPTSASPSVKRFQKDLAVCGVSPENIDFKAIHVAGTKGKGSVTAYCTSLLLELRSQHAGIGKIGTYTSPHLLDVRERICIDGKPVAREVFAKHFFEVWAALSEVVATDAGARSSYTQEKETKDIANPKSAGNLSFRWGAARETQEDTQKLVDWAWGPYSKPFFFWFLTLVAFRIFVYEGVNSAVVEVGIGGLHDPTNVLDASQVSVAVVTQLGLDHMALLGNTIEQIAEQKAGIFKAGRPAITRDLTASGYQREKEARSVMQVLRTCAQKTSAHMIPIQGDGTDWPARKHEDGDGGKDSSDLLKHMQDRHTTAPALRGRMGGGFQAHNRALAILAVREHLRSLGIEYPEILNQEGTTTSPDLSPLPPEWEMGLSKARLRGRCETLRLGVMTWHLDGAHTSDSLEETGKWLSQKLIARSNDGSAHRGSKTRAERPSKVLVFNQADRDAVWLLNCLTTSIKKSFQWESGEPPLFDLAVFTRNEVVPPTAEEGERKMDVPVACKRAMDGERLSARTVTVDNVLEAVSLCRGLNEGTGLQTDVLVTGSIHLVASAIKVLELQEGEGKAEDAKAKVMEKVKMEKERAMALERKLTKKPEPVSKWEGWG